MPVTTDNLYNIKRLNRVFAVSAILLVVSLIWAVWADHDREWRRIQRASRAWTLALVDHRAGQVRRQANQQELESLGASIAQLEAKYGRPAGSGAPPIEPGDLAQKADVQELRDLSSRIDNLSLRLNNLKSEVSVSEAELQQASARGDAAAVHRLGQRLAQPRQQVAQWTEQIGQWQRRSEQLRQAIAGRRAELTRLLARRRQLEGELAALSQRKAELTPAGFWSKAGAWVRSWPLLQWINPTERVRQLVLSDVQSDLSFARVEVTDRCITCHVNIDSRDFSRARIVAFLEGEVARSRGWKLPASAPSKPEDPQASAAAPGAAALPEFWHVWGRELGIVVKANSPRLKVLSQTVGHGSDIQPLQVWYGGAAVESFEYKPEEKDVDARQRQDAILVAIIKAWCMVERPADPEAPIRADLEMRSADGRVRVRIDGDIERGTFGKARFAALKYPEALRGAILTQSPPTVLQTLEEQYRVALVQEVNKHRQARGEVLLDPSPVFLAHPKLELYAQSDSPHSMERIGCTSCHDGAGNEIDFILASHRPRPTWVDAKTGVPVLERQLTISPHGREKPTLASMTQILGTTANGIPAGVSRPRVMLSADGLAADAVALEQAKPTRYTDPVSGAAGIAIPQKKYWAVRYEKESGTTLHNVEEMWDLPMRKPAHVQAACARCHVNVTDVAREAPQLHEGRLLFARLGCVNCHPMDSIAADDPKDPHSGDRKNVGQDLRNIDAKLSPAFVNTWVWSPKSFRPSTLMPHFFMLENNSSPEELRRTRTEARAMTEYLFAAASRYPQGGGAKAASVKWQPANPYPDKLKGDVTKGQEIFERIGCAACHTNLADWVEWDDPDTKKEPVKRRAELWIVTDLQQRLGMSEDNALKAYELMDYAQRQWYALEQFGTLTSTGPQPTYADGKTEKPQFITHGPELSAIGDKLLAGRSAAEARGWLFDWLMQPRHYSATTTMPQMRLSDQEAVHLVEYLLAQHRKNLDKKDAWSAELFAVDALKLQELVAWFLRGPYTPEMADTKAADPAEVQARAAEALTGPSLMTSAQATAAAQSMTLQQQQMVFLGKKLVAAYGCFNCHATNGMEGAASPCPDLSEWGQKQVSKLDFGFLDPHKTHDQRPLAAPLVNGLGPAVAKPGGPSFLTATVELSWPQLEATRESWLFHKLRNPRIFDRGRVLLEPKSLPQTASVAVSRRDPLPIPDRGRPYDKLKMPSFFLSDRQAATLVTFVTSNRPRLIAPSLLAQVNDTEHQRLAAGRQVAERFNCTGCHAIQGNYPAFQQYFAKEKEDMSRFWLLAPPELRGEGSRIQHAWLFNFLKNVEAIRPQVVTRMPSFALSEREAQQLVAYFAAVSQQESMWLRQRLEPVEKYITFKEKTTKKSAREVDEPWPGDDWYKQDAFAQQTQELRDWAMGLRLPQMTASNFDARRTRGFEADKVHRTLLFNARFVARLQDTPYPLVDSPRPRISPELFKKGEAFFRELECMKCHLLGDARVLEKVKLPEPPKGPNLSGVGRRLQRRWVDQWVQQTNLVLPVGSPMPPFFDGLPAWKLEGLPFGQDAATLENMPEEKRQRIEDHMKRFGATAPEQKSLLLQFLYAAANENYTVVPPSTQPAASQPAAARP